MLTQIYNQLIADRLKHDIVVYTNAKSIINVALVSIIAIPLYAIIYYIFNDPKVSYLLLTLSLFFFCSIWVIKNIGSLVISREIFVSSLFLCLFLISYYTGGFTSPSVIWLVLPPLLAVVFGDIKSGIFWGVVCIICFLILFLGQYFNIPLPASPITSELLLRIYSYSGLVIVIFLLAYFFDLAKKEAILKLEIAKRESDYLTQKAQEAIRVKNEFLQNMSHELRTPLNGIVGFAELISDSKVTPEATNEFSKIILSSSKDLTRMISEILDMSQIEFGQIEFSPTSVDLPKLMNEVKMIHQDSITEKKIHFNSKIDPAINKVNQDPDKLRFMISSYLSNAIKFSHTAGKIEIRAFPYDDGFCIEVEDQGIGIAKENLDKLFMPFEQLDMSMTKKYQGIGIGLALTRRIAEAGGGKVGAKSEFGKGSVFFVRLPKA